jgi:hypothetical protein
MANKAASVNKIQNGEESTALFQKLVDIRSIEKHDPSKSPAINDSLHGLSSITMTRVAALLRGLCVTKDVDKRKISSTAVISDQDAWYGHPLSVQDAVQQMPMSGGGGFIWNVTIVPDQFLIPSKGLKRVSGLNHRDFIAASRSPAERVKGECPLRIKPRRPSLPVTAKDFCASLTKIESKSGSKGARYIFHGILNGWPGLRTMELVSLEYRSFGDSVIPSLKEWFAGQNLWVQDWCKEEDTDEAIDLRLRQQNRIYRAKMRGPPWTAMGWSEDSPGFCLWYEAQWQPPKITYGTRLLSELAAHRDSLCTRVHMISHRHAVERVETLRDRMYYHSVVLLEWDHNLYSTVIEFAYLNSTSGDKGRCDWYEDLYQAFPPEMIFPWRSTEAEILCFDVKAKNIKEFLAYMAKYEGGRPPQGRFLDVHSTFSHDVCLTSRSKAHIAQYLLNYVSGDSRYRLFGRNCQDFAADLCSFLSGKKAVPFHAITRIPYQNRSCLFLYDSHSHEK